MNVLVFCGSRSGVDPTYTELARTVGSALSTHHCGLVCGGGSVGLMGVLASTMLKLGAPVIGVIPTFLATSEVMLADCTELIEVPSMHIRKQVMIDRCDAIIAMPGAYGTLDELFEALTWLQLGLHDRPIGILNHQGFYEPLIQQLDRMVEAGFLTVHNRRLVMVESQPELLIESLLRGPTRPVSESVLKKT
ncbi:MAG: TIGR00730 family Rossman fold protein [Ignavibacteriae bacterium]|nr:MAG: TIGR00730 family Rossman fold protein [Ignavibacteriota bacterium]